MQQWLQQNQNEQAQQEIRHPEPEGGGNIAEAVGEAAGEHLQRPHR